MDPKNLYAPPLEPAPASRQRAPDFKLHSHHSVGIATFLGSPIAGGLLMAANHRMLERPGRGLNILFLTGGLTLFLLLAAFNLPDSASQASSILAFLPAFILQWWAKNTFKADQDLHAAQGGALASRWKAASLGLLCGAAILGSIFLFFQNQMGERYPVSAQEEIYYKGGTTKAEVKALGDLMKEIGFFNGQGAKTLILEKEEAQRRFILSFVILPGIEKDPTNLQAFEDLIQPISSRVLGGAPLLIHLLDDKLKLKQLLPREASP